MVRKRRRWREFDSTSRHRKKRNGEFDDGEKEGTPPVPAAVVPALAPVVETDEEKAAADRYAALKAKADKDRASAEAKRKRATEAEQKAQAALDEMSRFDQRRRVVRSRQE